MKKFLKWGVPSVLVIAVAAVVGFLYFVPPFTSMAPEEFIKPAAAMAPPVDGIADPAERLIAERGRYIVLTRDCTGCHTTQDGRGPKADMYLGGGLTFITNSHGAVTTRNLTPDKATGLGTRTDDEIKAVLRAGVFHTGRPIAPLNMPWAAYSNLTDEDIHAVITYLRHLKPVKHAVPDPVKRTAEAAAPGSVEVVFPVDPGKQ